MAARTRLLASFLAGLAWSCGGAPAAPAPTTAPAPQRTAENVGWQHYTDAEQIHALHVSPTQVWGASQLGLVWWDRASRQFRAEVGDDAPGSNVKAVAVADDGTVYAGLTNGLTWRGKDGRWQRLQVAPLSSGVTGLARRTAGGVWVGTIAGLGWFDAGRMHVVSTRHRVRGLTVGSDGTVWAATDGHGVLRIQGDRLVEYTSGQGLCGNHVSGMWPGHGGQVVFRCSDPASAEILTVWDGRGMRNWKLMGVAASVDGGWTTADGLVLLAGDRMLRFGDWRPQKDADGKMPPPPSVRAVAVTATAGLPDEPAPPPAPEPAAPPVAQQAGADAGEAGEPAPGTATDQKQAGATGGEAASAGQTPAGGAAATSPEETSPEETSTGTDAAPDRPAGGLSAELGRALDPKPAAPAEQSTPAAALAATPAPAAPRGPIVQAPMPVERAEVKPELRPGTLAGKPYASGVPTNARVTAIAVTADETAWYALAHRGVLAVRGNTRTRYASLDLVPDSETTRLVALPGDRLVMTRSDNTLLRWEKGTWRLWSVHADKTLNILGIAADAHQQVWVVGARDEKPELVILKGDEQGRFAELGVVDATAVGGPARLGRMVVDARGRLVFPLYRVDGGKVRGVGMGRVPPTLAGLEIWAPGTEREIPDTWVSAVGSGPGGDVTYVATNSGLVKVSGDQTRVFNENDFLESEIILDVAVDRDGTVWAATMEGLGTVQGETWTAVEHASLGEDANAVAVDANGRVWVGSSDGIWRRQGKGWARLSLAGGVEVGAIREIVPDREGGVWLLTAQGLLRKR